MSFFSAVWDDIKGFFTDSDKDLLAFFEAGIHSVAQNGGQVLADAAKAAVASAEAAGGSAQVKLAAAGTAVVATLTAEGIPVVWNAINIAIEAAVAQMKANQAAAVPTPAPATPPAA